MQNYLQSFPQECDEILAEGRAVCAINNIFEHTHLWEAFLTQIEAGKEACVVVMTVTDEGNPILYYIHFDGTDYMEAFQTLDESNAYWEKMYALYEEGKIDPNGENEYQPFPLTMIYTVWE